MRAALQASSEAENADAVQRELALLQDGPSDSNDTMADDSDEPLGQDLGLQFGGCDMQPDHEAPNRRVSIPETTQAAYLLEMELIVSSEQVHGSVQCAERPG